MTDATNGPKTATGDAVIGFAGAMFAAVKGIVEVVELVGKIKNSGSLRKAELSPRRSAFGLVGAFVGGVAVGAGLGMLLAPMSGRKTRGLLAARAQELGEGVKTTAMDAVERVEEKVADVVEKAEVAPPRPERRQASGRQGEQAPRGGQGRFLRCWRGRAEALTCVFEQQNRTNKKEG